MFSFYQVLGLVTFVEIRSAGVNQVLGRLFVDDSYAEPLEVRLHYFVWLDHGHQFGHAEGFIFGGVVDFLVFLVDQFGESLGAELRQTLVGVVGAFDHFAEFFAVEEVIRASESRV